MKKELRKNLLKSLGNSVMEKRFSLDEASTVLGVFDKGLKMTTEKQIQAEMENDCDDKNYPAEPPSENDINIQNNGD